VSMLTGDSYQVFTRKRHQNSLRPFTTHYRFLQKSKHGYEGVLGHGLYSDFQPRHLREVGMGADGEIGCYFVEISCCQQGWDGSGWRDWLLFR
jgi:hypothetical protein